MRQVSNTVFVVDDDASVRDALGLLLGLHGYPILFFANAQNFLDTYSADWRGCLLIDIRMPGMNGLVLQKHLQDLECAIPVVIITGHGDVASAREAFRANAIDFLEKPFDESRLLKAIDDAFDMQSSIASERDHKARLSASLSELTRRERQVMELVVSGHHHRDIATDLGISVRTVEVHKGCMMSKLKVDSVPQLVRMSLGLAGQE
jgi:FixJ family two-component response regulator